MLEMSTNARGWECSAVISPCERYRYQLTRRWNTGRTVVFIMLNPSTADAFIDDPTIRRVCNFAQRWGFAGVRVVNLFALRAKDPQALTKAEDPIGPENDQRIWDACDGGDQVILAWGAHGALQGRGAEVMAVLMEGEFMLWHLGLTKDGHPRHPLYLPTTVERQPLFEIDESL